MWCYGWAAEHSHVLGIEKDKRNKCLLRINPLVIDVSGMLCTAKNAPLTHTACLWWLRTRTARSIFRNVGCRFVVLYIVFQVCKRISSLGLAYWERTLILCPSSTLSARIDLSLVCLHQVHQRSERGLASGTIRSGVRWGISIESSIFGIDSVITRFSWSRSNRRMRAVRLDTMYD